MSMEKYLEVLQSLITMVDETSPTSISCFQTALNNIYALARESKKADARTIRMMESAAFQAQHLAHCKNDFAGTPGDYLGNKAKRRHLMHMIMPGC